MVKNYIILALFLFALTFGCLYSCESGIASEASILIKKGVEKLHASNDSISGAIEVIHDTIKVAQVKIEYRDREVVKWKTRKASIRYIADPDSTSTIQQVRHELTNCDSTVKIDSVIIADLDSNLQDQRKVIAKKEEELILVDQKLHNKDKEIELAHQETKEANKKAGRRERRGFGFGFVLGYLAGLATPK